MVPLLSPNHGESNASPCYNSRSKALKFSFFYGPNSSGFGKKNSKLSNVYDKLRCVAKNIEKKFYFFFTFISSMWPNLAKLIFWMVATLATSQNPQEKTYLGIIADSWVGVSEFFIGEFSPNFYLKNMIFLLTQRIFH
jgi:hypothetical protein